MDLFSLVITTPLGYLIELIYKMVQNYGLAIILFTIIIKLILLPLTIKSQKSMKKQQNYSRFWQNFKKSMPMTSKNCRLK